MVNPAAIPRWLESLPLAPEYHPTDTEFADPIAFISRIEESAAAFGICKVIPPVPKPSRRFVLSNLSRSISTDSNAAGDAVFTTRFQELGSRRTNKQVWQSGEIYTLDRFEAKSKAFSRSHLSNYKDVGPLLIESLFWRAAAEKTPIYIEYANDVPGSGFSAPQSPPSDGHLLLSPGRKRKRRFQPGRAEGMEATSGWRLSNSPWNLQTIARSPGSLTRFMPYDVPGVTSPMVYIGMLFSWFAWHVEDHELHSLNFLHMGAPKTWYAIPGKYAGALEEIMHAEGYGGDLDRLAALTMLGEKTNLLSPEVLVAAGIPCCRLVQHPGEFVVTFPRAYHVGFSHGFNCGEAANFATPEWLKVAKEAAVRRAAMNYLPMLSHQQLLHLLTMSFVFRVPQELLYGVRSSRFKDRLKEEREFSIKKAFIEDMARENNLLCVLIGRESSSRVVLWDPDLLPAPSNVQLSTSSSMLLNTKSSDMDAVKEQGVPGIIAEDKFVCKENEHVKSYEGTVGSAVVSGDDLPFGLNLHSGSVACVACGILGYPFMAIVQPSERASKMLFPVNCQESSQKMGMSGPTRKTCESPLTCVSRKGNSGILGEIDILRDEKDSNSKLLATGKMGSGATLFESDINGSPSTASNLSCFTVHGEISTSIASVSVGKMGACNSADGPTSSGLLVETSGGDIGIGNHLRLKHKPGYKMGKPFGHCEPNWTNVQEVVDNSGKSAIVPVEVCEKKNAMWNTSNGVVRPRIFCLQHAFEIEELLHCLGGAHVLIICYSDYLKIKAQTMDVANEFGNQFNIKDVLIHNASPADLDLINVSVDDEHEELSEDWTSKLGVNLKYCVKLRKQASSPNREHPTLALDGILSDLHPSSLVSRLKWKSRKTRTPKAYLSRQSRPGDVAAMRSSSIGVNENSSMETIVYRRCKGQAGNMPIKQSDLPRQALKKPRSSIDAREVTGCHHDGSGSGMVPVIECFMERQDIGRWVSSSITSIDAHGIVEQEDSVPCSKGNQFQSSSVTKSVLVQDLDGEVIKTSENTHTFKSLLKPTHLTLQSENFEAEPKESHDGPVEKSSMDISCVSMIDNCCIKEVIQQTANESILSSLLAAVELDMKSPIIVYTRKAGRNKGEVMQHEFVSRVNGCNDLFIRSPCEGLRPRPQRKSEEYKVDMTVKEKQRHMRRRGKHTGNINKKFDIGGCPLRSRTNKKLSIHKRNPSIFKGFQRRFRSHLFGHSSERTP